MMHAAYFHDFHKEYVRNNFYINDLKHKQSLTKVRRLTILDIYNIFIYFGYLPEICYDEEGIMV